MDRHIPAYQYCLKPMQVSDGVRVLRIGRRRGRDKHRAMST